MRDKTDQIIKAAIKVFAQKGFVQSTTLEIAKEAEVAEITLYRKFSSKQNLFVTVVRKVLENKFKAKMMKLAEEEDTELFLSQMISNRLEVITKNDSLIKMLLSESLMGNLPDEINLPAIIFESLKESLSYHFNKLGREVDTELLARNFGAILIGHVVFPSGNPYGSLTEKERDGLIKKYTASLMSLIE